MKRTVSGQAFGLEGEFVAPIIYDPCGVALDVLGKTGDIAIPASSVGGAFHIG